MTVRVLTAVENQDSAIVHASCVALDGRGLLITGDSGSGKSGLALQLMALGALLVADDRVELKMSGNKVTAHSPANIRGLIEARGLGLLRADTVGPVALAYVVDLNRTETARLPDPVDATRRKCCCNQVEIEDALLINNKGEHLQTHNTPPLNEPLLSEIGK